MGSNNNMTLIERLTGRDNFASWKFAVKTYLEHEDLWECVSGTGEVDPKKDVKAKSKIILLVDPINYVHVQDASSAKEVWEKLCKAFDDSGLTRRVGLLRDLITTTLENCQSIEEYVNKIMTTAHKLRNIGFKVDDEWLGTLLLAGLPDEYKPMIMAIESSGVAITADSIKTKLLQEVKNRDPSVFFVNKSKNNKQLFKQNKQTKGPRSTNNNNSGWYVDSGAAMHMTMNKDWIYDETPPPIKTIRVANDKELRVESCGKVNIHVKSKNGSTNSIQRLGHLNYNDMKKLKDHTDGVTMPQNSELTCVPCIKGNRQGHHFHVKTSTPYTPQQNGLSERMNRTLLEKARCMLINANLQKSLWAEAIRTAAYITNRTPTRALNYKTPEEVWSGRKPDLSHMRIFGCEAMMHIPKEKLKKWDSKSCKMIFVGYCEDSKGYRLLDPKTKTVTKSRDVVFLENSIKTDTVPVTLSDTKKQQVSRNSLSESSDCSTDISTHTAVESDDGDEEYVPEQSIGTPPTSNITLRPHNRPNPKVEPKSYLCMANVPQTYEDALSSEDSELWIKSIKEELKAHEDNGTWELVKKPDNVRLLDCKWVFRVKNEESSTRYKARLCAKGFAQKSGIDYTETFSPTVRYDSIRLLLSIAAEKRMTIMQFDIKAAFLYGKLEEEIYMKPPEGLDVENSMACKLIKSLYGLKQAPRCWNAKFNSVLNKYGFFNSHADKCVYVSSNREAQVYLLLYVDDGLLCSTSPTIITEVLNHLQKEFNVKICKTSNFIGIQIEQCKDYIFIHQRKYIEELLSKFDLDNANPNSIPADPHVTLQKSTVLENKKCFPYREAVGSLMFAAIVTRPDIMFAVSTVSRFLNSHDQSHWNAVKKIFKYLKGTLSFGLCFRSNENNTLESYSDADYANDPVTRRSTTGYVFMKNGAAVTWSSQRQTTVALSTTEAEFMASCSATKKLSGLDNYC
ncbi:Retrovirus-related Pol polyprotein from transposon TNT 1-94 [Eumeta japonica]|uniref:Retrovirus-related Pol polyprotein from transposon TNT 1-94 n=1 Tax=Eumeta variegata TaxID=151549 RepID=A0A4C1W9H5_EUMVA|nr:Retrovirus-related Pol polyprotein from transposon TNT 1-94 [Eumeta japonica]